MATKRTCAWCGQVIKKTMQCASVMPENCYWVPKVREVGVKEAIRHSMGCLEAKSVPDPSLGKEVNHG